MKKLIYISTLALFASLSLAHAGEKKPGETTIQTPGETKPGVKTQAIGDGETNNSSMMMKIQTDEKADEARRKEFLEELRKLYKANFL